LEILNEDLPEWYHCPEDPASQQYKYSWCTDGKDLGRGLLIASGGSIKFKSDVGQEQQNVVADYFDNGDIAGIYTRNQEVFMDES
jgi:hypothetical protein